MEKRLEPVRLRAITAAGVALEPLFAANALHGWVSDEQFAEIQRGGLGAEVELVDWGYEVYGQQADGAPGAGLGDTRAGIPRLSGKGVTVAVLDSGIDARHPFLSVADAVNTCPEPCTRPGWHGTHCAGVIASRSPRYPGLAPGVRLLDIKVARANGFTSPGWFAQGIDEALEAGADVLSISFGMNHFPARISDGHDWSCLEGRCLLCRAVDHATACGAVVVAAAGNGHLRAQALRESGEALSPGAELLCPGSAKSALTVGAIEKTPTARLSPLSSRGFPRPGIVKPDVLAPGGDIMSTVPISEHASLCSPLDLFSMGSGTSVATAVVAGVVALLIEEHRSAGLPWTPTSIRRDLLSRCVPLWHDENAMLAMLEY